MISIGIKIQNNNNNKINENNNNKNHNNDNTNNNNYQTNNKLIKEVYKLEKTEIIHLPNEQIRTIFEI